MSNEIIDFDSSEPDNQDNQEDATSQSDAVAFNRIASLNARAVMPDGKLLDRSQILSSLGLNPNTSPTAWLAVFGCGSNASALLPSDLQRVATNRVSNAASVLSKAQRLSSSARGNDFVSGGKAPTK